MGEAAKVSQSLRTEIGSFLNENTETMSYNEMRCKLEDCMDNLEKKVIDKIFTEKSFPINQDVQFTSTERFWGQKLYNLYNKLMEEFTN